MMDSLRNNNSINGDQFKATAIWNHLIDTLRERVEIGNYKRRFKMYKNCFIACKAVDCLHLYLSNHKELKHKLSDRTQVVKLINIFVKMGVIKKVYWTNKSLDFQDNRDLYEFVTCTQVEQEDNKENQLIYAQMMVPRNDLNCSKSAQTPPKQINTIVPQTDHGIKPTVADASSSSSGVATSTSVSQINCLKCAVETKGNQILRFLNKISLQRWPLGVTTNVSNHAHGDQVDGHCSGSTMNEMRTKSMQLLAFHSQNSSNHFSRNNSMYQTLKPYSHHVPTPTPSSLPLAHGCTVQEPIYSRTVHPNSLSTAHSVQLHQSSFNTLV